MTRADRERAERAMSATGVRRPRHPMVITTWHGEGRTLWLVVDTAAPTREQPAVLATYSSADGYTRADAERHARVAGGAAG